MTNVPRETLARLERLKALVLDEANRQNLISPASTAQIDTRHVADSLQLLDHLPNGVLVDIGTGGGFPGLVLACHRAEPVHLVEPRSKRADFLERAANDLGLTNVKVWACKIEAVPIRDADAITARAVASLSDLFSAALPVATRATRWVLPKGRSAQSELDTARLSWQGDFALVPSATDPDARIVLASNVHRRGNA